MKKLFLENGQYWKDCCVSLRKNWKGVTFVLSLFTIFYFGFCTIVWYWNEIKDFFIKKFKKNDTEETVEE